MTAFGLTKKQLDLFTWIYTYIRENDCAPTYDEMAVGIGITSRSEIVRLLNALQSRGYVDWIPKSSRSLRILRMPDDGMSFLPANIRAALSAHCARTGEKPFQVLCAAIEKYLDAIERSAA